MSHKFTILLVLVFFGSVACFSLAQAQWGPDGTPICRAQDDQESPIAVADGYGGAIIAWRDYRIGFPNRDIYAQRIDALGNVLWTTDGVMASNPATNENSHVVVSDGAGGAILAWYEGTYPEVDIYAQRIDLNGNLSWPVTGVPVCTLANTQTDPYIIADGSGGAIIAWEDLRGGVDYDLYAQRINAVGTALWTADGVAVATATGTQGNPVIVSDGADGAIIAWQDGRGAEMDVYAQYLDGGGNALWDSGGIPVTHGPFSQSHPWITTDGSGGAIVAWEDERSGEDDIYARRVSSLGDTLWTAGGVAICTATDRQRAEQIMPDGRGGAIIVWRDGRSGGTVHQSN
jgi:hypothetical protein